MRNLQILVLLSISILTGCASSGPRPAQDWQPSSQPDTGELTDYLHFAGLSYGDTFEDVVNLFGEPTEVNLNDGRDGSKYFNFVSNYYDLDGERCLEVSYDKLTRRVKVVRIECDEVRIRLLKKGVDDPKLARWGKNREEVFSQYGTPEYSASENYEYNYRADGNQRGLVHFTCYKFWDYLCKEIYVHWFY